MSDLRQLWETHEYVDPISIYGFTSKDKLLSLFEADRTAEHLGRVTLTLDRPEIDFGNLEHGQQLELEVDSISQETTINTTVNRLVTDFDRQNIHNDRIKGLGRLIINNDENRELLYGPYGRLGVLQQVSFTALIPSPRFANDESKVLTTVQLPIFEPKHPESSAEAE